MKDMSNPNFKPGDRVYCTEFGKGTIRAIRTNDALVEFVNHGVRQYCVKYEDMELVNKKGNGNEI